MKISELTPDIIGHWLGYIPEGVSASGQLLTDINSLSHRLSLPRSLTPAALSMNLTITRTALSLYSVYVTIILSTTDLNPLRKI